MTDLHPALPAAVQPERSGELHPGALVAAIDRAATENDAIRLLTQKFPEWSISKARKLAREIRADQEIARERAVLPPVAGDRLGRAMGERQMRVSRRLVHDLPDLTGDRAVFRLDRLAAMPQLPKKKPSAAMAVAPRAGVPPTRKKEEPMTIISDVTHTGESETATVRDIPALPQRPLWATATGELIDEYDGTWLLEFSTPIGTFGLELVEMCQYTPAAGWTVYASMGALVPQLNEIDTADGMRAFAEDFEQGAVITVQHTRPVGTPA